MADVESTDWNLLVKTNAPVVFRVAFRILGSIQDAEDVSQDVFVDALQFHRKERVNNWPGFLTRLVTLKAIDRLRRNRKHFEICEQDKVSTLEPIEYTAVRELSEWLRGTISKLPEQQAAIFVLHHFEQLSRDQISEALGITREAVSTSLFKARKCLWALWTTLNQGDVNEPIKFPH